MKKLLLILLLPLLFSCSTNVDKRQVDSLNVLYQDLDIKIFNQKKTLVQLHNKRQEFVYIEENRQPKYIMKFRIYQSHFTLDIGTHIKDKINAFEIELPVDKEYYNSINIGTEISEQFRFGSLLLSGSIGDWNIKVINKRLG